VHWTVSVAVALVAPVKFTSPKLSEDVEKEQIDETLALTAMLDVVVSAKIGLEISKTEDRNIVKTRNLCTKYLS
jgi:hypothetical protein